MFFEVAENELEDTHVPPVPTPLFHHKLQKYLMSYPAILSRFLNKCVLAHADPTRDEFAPR